MIETIKRLFKFWKNPTKVNADLIRESIEDSEELRPRYDISPNGSTAYALDKKYCKRKAAEVAMSASKIAERTRKGKNCE